jgi:hypothetical protein
MELVDRKTACLFSACAKLGAVAAGADTQAEEKLGEFAWNLGMAFQLIDDMLDFTRASRRWASRWAAISKKAKSRCRWSTRSRTRRGRTPPGRNRAATAITRRCPSPTILAMVERHGGSAAHPRTRPAVHRSRPADRRGIPRRTPISARSSP